jgi:hypothetical protein
MNIDDRNYYTQLYDNVRKGIRICYVGIAIVLLLIFLSSLFSSCRSIQYVPVEKVKTEYIVKTDSFIQRDSVYCIDSVWVEKRGDTITLQKTKIIYKDKWREVVKTDSFIKVDSVQVPYPVERNLTKWEKVKMDMGGMAIGACIIIIIVVLIFFLAKVLRKT